ncbi:hypothetical protein LIER_40264 [Lithospermum erythrorhizon]|uniref:Reverse transcriptase zinc-binding domain-containing protein n=1 Tax=Lithospermum erythrorhizon TaxID=34254 RepID=A0AAV3QUF4_LITER
MDSWLPSVPLLNHLAGFVPVKHFMTDGYWNLMKQHEYGPNDQVSNILQCEVRRENSDELIWKASNHGNFNLKATWKLLREIQPFSGFCGSGENIDHIFIDCEIAIWQYFHDLFDIQYIHYSSPFHLLINWLDKSANVGHICMVIACIALWAIWEGRNKKKNEDQVISKTSILSRIYQQDKLNGDRGMVKPVYWRGDM